MYVKKKILGYGMGKKLQNKIFGYSIYGYKKLLGCQEVDEWAEPEIFPPISDYDKKYFLLFKTVKLRKYF